MILNQISYLDCIVFLILLAPQLLLRVGLIETIICVLQALPFFLIKLPLTFIKERYFTKYASKSPFVQHASPFQDFVVRCVRYAFARIPASIGKVFFSKPVALPFLYFRMFRHGVFKSPIHWETIARPDLNGIWITTDSTKAPDVVIYYCHGGGFSMGSSYFYLEFLLAWVALLKSEGGFTNPALFALEYTLVPEATYPQQIHETLSGYEFVLSKVGSSDKIVVSGDSAGATLQLSLLLYIAKEPKLMVHLPGLAVMISPWTIIVSQNNKNTPSDYLNAESLHLYGRQYIGTKAEPDDPLVSPGACRDVQWWQQASPSKGWFFIYGSEEVFAPDTRELAAFLGKIGTDVKQHEERGWVHAWPVVKLFLCDGQDARQSGLRSIIGTIKERL